jgi:hypothetical protein
MHVSAVQNVNRTILGPRQTQYLKEQLSASQGQQTWKVLGQQVRFQLPARVAMTSCKNAGPLGSRVLRNVWMVGSDGRILLLAHSHGIDVCRLEHTAGSVHPPVQDMPIAASFARAPC